MRRAKLTLIRTKSSQKAGNGIALSGAQAVIDAKNNSAKTPSLICAAAVVDGEQITETLQSKPRPNLLDGSGSAQ